MSVVAYSAESSTQLPAGTVVPAGSASTPSNIGTTATQGAEVVTSVSSILSVISGLFTGSSYDATHQKILQWVALIAGNPTQAATGVVSRGAGYDSTPQGAWLALRCWAGDQTILATYRQASGDPAANGCGCEVAHGCRVDAQTSVATLRNTYPQLVTGALSTSPIPSNPSATGGSSVLSNVLVGVPAPTTVGGTVTVFGVSIYVWLIGIALLVFFLARRNR